MGENSLNHFDLILDSIDLDVVNNLDLDDDNKKLMLAFMICENLKGMKILVPTKAHKRVLAKKMLEDGADVYKIHDELGLDRRTIKKIKDSL